MHSLYLKAAPCLAVFLAAGATRAQPGVDPCVACHDTITPGIITQYNLSKHAKVGVKCFVCHEAKEDDPSGYDHQGYRVTAVPSPRYCEGCHDREVTEQQNSKHAWAAFLGPLEPYYKKAREMGLDPMAQTTARKLDPVETAARSVSPLFPDSGLLAKTGLLRDPDYHRTNVSLTCTGCHGSFLVAGEDGELAGWPNVGVGRINPDGSLGSCTSCHTRHIFSVAEARKPETCGQCHPGHTQDESYEDSKHGNIYASMGHEWNWNVPPGQWGPTDIVAPSCSTCHISAFGEVEGSHDPGRRLYWELQPAMSVPRWKGPEDVDFVLERVSDSKQAKRGRDEMKEICYQCHSSRWADSHFDRFDKVISDYNKLWTATDNLLEQAYEEGLISREYPLDETPEITHYLIGHQDGRRWRLGASMMGHHSAHSGAVGAIMHKLGTMLNDLEMRRALASRPRRSKIPEAYP